MRKISTIILTLSLAFSSIGVHNVVKAEETKTIAISPSVEITEKQIQYLDYSDSNPFTGSALFEHIITKNDIHYSYSNGVLTATGTGIADASYTSVCQKQDIKKVVISSGIIGVADHAFKGCKNIETISFSDTVKKIGCYAFHDAKLHKLTIPATVRTIKNDLTHRRAYYKYNFIYDPGADFVDSTLMKCKWIVKTHKLTGKSMINLFRISNKKAESKFLNDPKNKIKKINNMYISKDGVLLKYTGNASSVTIPSNVKVIGDFAFSQKKNVKNVYFSKS